MAWGRRRSKSSFVTKISKGSLITIRPPKTTTTTTSVWQTAGETCSLKNALAMYGLTEQEVSSADPPIPCQWRSCHGNSYAVVQLSDMAALRDRLTKQKLLDKYGGQEGYEKHMAQEEAQKEAKKSIELVKEQVLILIKTTHPCGDGDGAKSSRLDDNEMIAKTRAKQDWHLRDSELEDLKVEKVGRTIKYNLRSVIAAAEKRHGQKILLEKLEQTPLQLGQYGRYLREIFDKNNKYSADLIQEACQEARKSIHTSIEDATEKVCETEAAAKKAQNELKKRKTQLCSFDDFETSLGVGLSSVIGNDKENNRTNKKAKVV